MNCRKQKLWCRDGRVRVKLIEISKFLERYLRKIFLFFSPVEANAPIWWSHSDGLESMIRIDMLHDVCSDSQRVHLYGGVSAMRSDVMPLQWERKCIVQDLSFSLSLSLLLPASLPKPLADPFSEPWLDFLEAFGGEFSFALFLPECGEAGDRKAYLCFYPWKYWVGRQ